MIKIYRRLFLLPHCLRHIEKALATLHLCGLQLQECFLLPFRLFSAPSPPSCLAPAFLHILSNLLGPLGLHHMQFGSAGGPPGYGLLATAHSCQGLSAEVIPLLSIISPTHCNPQTPREPCSFYRKHNANVELCLQRVSLYVCKVS